MKVYSEISLGELIDKISILMVKQTNIKDKSKLENVQTEYLTLWYTLNKLDIDAEEYIDRLFEVNKTLWDIEDNIRKKEKNKEFDKGFIELARSVYKTNDERFKIKNEINNMFESEIKEEKDYENYQ